MVAAYLIDWALNHLASQGLSLGIATCVGEVHLLYQRGKASKRGGRSNIF
jgi:hypothetical protein